MKLYNFVKKKEFSGKSDVLSKCIFDKKTHLATPNTAVPTEQSMRILKVANLNYTTLQFPFNLPNSPAHRFYGSLPCEKQRGFASFQDENRLSPKPCRAPESHCAAAPGGDWLMLGGPGLHREKITWLMGTPAWFHFRWSHRRGYINRPCLASIKQWQEKVRKCIISADTKWM